MSGPGAPTPDGCASQRVSKCRGSDVGEDKALAGPVLWGLEQVGSGGQHLRLAGAVRVHDQDLVPSQLPPGERDPRPVGGPDRVDVLTSIRREAHSDGTGQVYSPQVVAVLHRGETVVWREHRPAPPAGGQRQRAAKGAASIEPAHLGVGRATAQKDEPPVRGGARDRLGIHVGDRGRFRQRDRVALQLRRRASNRWAMILPCRRNTR